jgi:hypothetical protein
MAESAALLVDDVLPHQPIRQWVLSFPFQLRFLLSSYPELMGNVLGIVQRLLSTHLIKAVPAHPCAHGISASMHVKAGLTGTTAQTGSVTLIQRFGSALNLNLHFHMLFLDGVYVENGHGNLRFQRVNAPNIEELRELVHAISHRVVRFLEKRGFLERDAESSYLVLEPDDDDAMLQLQGHSITYRIAVGPHQGRKVFTLQTLPPDEDCLGGTPSGSDRVAKEVGFSLHAGVSAEAHQRDKLERLCRYICRPAVSEKRLALTSNGNIRYQLKTPYRDGTTHVIFEPLDFIAKLAALVPKPRVNLTRFHGVLARGGLPPNNKFRVRVTPAKRGRGRKRRQPTGENWLDKTPAERHASMTWMHQQ